jgi:DNA polymerase III sliding clamp (beta) subunit (PCNA family)
LNRDARKAVKKGAFPGNEAMRLRLVLTGDGMRNGTSDIVELHLADASAPTLIRENDKSAALYVLMPMRV